MNTGLLVPFAVDLLLKSSAVVIFTWLTLQMWRRASAAQRGCIWCVAFALLAVLPLTRLAAPHWALSLSQAGTPVHRPPVAEPGESTVIGPEMMSAPPAQTGTMPDGAKLAVGVWLAGIFLLVVYRLTGAFLLHRCHRSSSPFQKDGCGEGANLLGMDLGIARPIDVRVSRNCRMPVTWGTRRPVVMFPIEALNWSPEWLESVLRHEVGHVKNYDHLKRMAAFLTCAFYWPNPLVWMASKQLQLAQEEASDNLVLQVGISPQAYATQLIELVRSTAGRGALSIPAEAMARPSTLENRLAAILDSTRNRKGMDQRLALAGTGLVLALGLALGAVQLRAEDPAAQPGFAPRTTALDRATFTQSLHASLLPHLDLKQVDVFDALNAVRVASQKMNPPGLEFRWMMAPQETRHRFTEKFDLKLDHCTLGDAIALLAKKARLHYRITPLYAYDMEESDSTLLHPHLTKVFCVLWPANSTEGRLTPYFLLSDAGMRVLHLQPGPSGDVRDSLEKWGIEFPPGTVATCKPQNKKPGFNGLEITDTGDQAAQVFNLVVAASPELLLGSDSRPSAITPGATKAPTHN